MTALQVPAQLGDCNSRSLACETACGHSMHKMSWSSLSAPGIPSCVSVPGRDLSAPL